jgi:AraC family transcriptional regulator
MSRSRTNSQSNPAQNRSGDYPNPAPKLSTIIPVLPAQMSYEARWRNATLESYWMPAGKHSDFHFDHYVVGIRCTQSYQIEMKVDGVANGRWQTLAQFNGAITLFPAHYSCSAHWQQPFESIMLNLKSDLLTDNATEVLGVDQVELLPQVLLDDPLIFQIAQALKADLESRRPGGRLYAETMTSTLAAHLVRNYPLTSPSLFIV